MKTQLKKLSKSSRYLVVSLILTITMSYTQSYFSLIFPQGTEVRSAKSLSMGWTGTASSIGIDNVWTNPALLETQNRFSVSLNGYLRRIEEKRAYPVMDMFDDVVVNNTYAANRNWDTDAAGGLVIALPKQLTLGLGQSVFWDITYDYAEEVRGSLPSGTYNRDPLRGYHEINRSGKIMSTDAGLNVSMLPMFKFGLGVHLLRDKNIQDRYGVTVLDPDEALASDTTFIRESQVSLDEKPIIYTLGAAFTPKKGLTLGFTYRTEVEIALQNLWSLPCLDETTLLPGYQDLTTLTEPGSVRTTLPETFSIGIETTLKNPIATKAVLELQYTDWTDYKQEVFTVDAEGVSTNPNLFQETWEIRGGIEHVFQNKLPFRFGFIYSESPLGQEFETTKITAGGAYRWGKAVFDYGVIIGSVQYRYLDLFKAVSEEIEYLDQVKESNVITTFSLTYEL